MPGLSVWGGRPVVRRCGDAAPRHRAVLDGTVRSIEVHRAPDGTPSLDVVLADGTGSVILRWLGRRVVAGVEPGCRLGVEGTVLAHRGRLVILNPLFLHGSPAGRLPAAGSAPHDLGDPSATVCSSPGSAAPGEPAGTGKGWRPEGGQPGPVSPGGGQPGLVSPPGGQSAVARGGTELSVPGASGAGDDGSVSSASW